MSEKSTPPTATYEIIAVIDAVLNAFMVMIRKIYL